MSRSSWTATADGPRSGISRESKGTARASRRSATSWKRPRGSAIGVLTLYAFSIENWKRPRAEVNTLMMLLKRYLRSELDTILSNNIRFRVIGRQDELPPDVQSELNAGIARTAAKHRDAVQHRAQLRRPRGNRRRRAGAPLRPASRRRISTRRRFGEFLYTAGQPDPDLLIRTSGEMRVSNFLLWQIAYSEIWVTDTLWPDFRCRHLLEAIVAYQKRDRRYGGIKPAPAGSVVLTAK